MAFPPRFLEELRDRVSLAALIGRRVKLERRGRSLTGLCPFHNEKSPSFNVVEEKGFYHCFGCGAHGDAIEFVRRTEGATFLEAVEKLAAEAGLPVPAPDPAARERFEREAKLRDPLEEATRWFEAQLAGPAGGQARRYLAERGLSAETISRFRLGYAPGQRHALKEAMLKKGVSEATLIEVGLLRPGDEGAASYDWFRDRVVFPIADARGRVIAFGARAMSGEVQPKYLNSPETPLFRKGSTLYNLAMAREAARTAGTVVVAEGYMDVIALAQAGIEHAVAPLGTALTEDQMRILWRMVPEPHLCFDGDKAGFRAALRGGERALPLLEPGHSLRFVLLPEGEDPDSLIRTRGRYAFEEAVGEAIPLAELLWRSLRASHPADTPERQAAFAAAVRALPDKIADQTVKSYYQKWMAGKLDELVPSGGRGKRPWRPGTPARGSKFQQSPEILRRLPPLESPRLRREQLLLALVVSRPDLLGHVDEALSELQFSRPDLDRLRHAVLEASARFPGLDSASLRRHLTDSNLGGVLDGIFRASAVRHQKVFRPEVDLDEVWRSFVETSEMLRRDTLLAAELRQEEAALAEDMSEDRLSGLRAVKRQQHQAAGETPILSGGAGPGEQ